MPLKIGLPECPDIRKVQLYDLHILIITTFYLKLVDYLEKCLIYGHIRRFAD
jgi:hypothetical protein